MARLEDAAKEVGCAMIPVKAPAKEGERKVAVELSDSRPIVRVNAEKT